VGFGELEQAHGVAFSRDGKRLVAAGGFKVCNAWELEPPRSLFPTLKDNDRFITSAAFSPDDKMLVTGSTSNSAGGTAAIRLWDVAAGKPIRTLSEEIGAYVARFNSDGSRLFTSAPAQLWDPASGKAVGPRLKLGEGTLTALAFSPDGRTLATATGFVDSGTAKGDVRLWDTVTGAMRGEPLPHPLVRAIVFSPKGKLLATGGWHGTRFWDAATGKEVGKPLTHEAGIWTLAFSPDGETLVAGSNGPRLWDVKTRQPRGPELNSMSLGGIPYLMTFDADGKAFWTVTIAGLYPWDAVTGRRLGGIRHQCENRIGSSFSPDGRRFAVAGNRMTTWIKRDAQGTFRGHSSSSPPVVMVWELPQIKQTTEDHADPMPGTAEQIILWLQVRTGRELLDGASFIQLPSDHWEERRKSLEKLGGPPVKD
jgi:WD40 repeat protein